MLWLRTLLIVYNEKAGFYDWNSLSLSLSLSLSYFFRFLSYCVLYFLESYQSGEEGSLLFLMVLFFDFLVSSLSLISLGSSFYPSLQLYFSFPSLALSVCLYYDQKSSATMHVTMCFLFPFILVSGMKDSFVDGFPSSLYLSLISSFPH